MEFVAELKKRARHVIAPALGALAVGYFAYHALHGERGLFALWRLEQKVAEAEQRHAALDARRQRLERRVRLLHPDSLDPDMLEERARAMLNYGRPDEYVFLEPEEPEQSEGESPRRREP